jgi:hypothetical protein
MSHPRHKEISHTVAPPEVTASVTEDTPSLINQIDTLITAIPAREQLLQDQLPLQQLYFVVLLALKTYCDQPSDELRGAIIRGLDNFRDHYVVLLENQAIAEADQVFQRAIFPQEIEDNLFYQHPALTANVVVQYTQALFLGKGEEYLFELRQSLRQQLLRDVMQPGGAFDQWNQVMSSIFQHLKAYDASDHRPEQLLSLIDQLTQWEVLGVEVTDASMAKA